MKKSLILASLLTLASLSMTACSSGNSEEKLNGEADYEVYSSVEDLTSASTAAYEVKVGDVVSRECDDGGDSSGHGGEPTPGPEDSDPEDASPTPSAASPTPSGIAGGESTYSDCLPMVFYKATIETIIYQGPAARGIEPVPLGELIIGNVDTEKVDLEGASPLVPGSYVVVYGNELSAADHPGITTINDDIWMPVGGEQGLFDVDPVTETATARSSNVRTLLTGDARSKSVSSEKFKTDIRSLKQAATAATS
ncbi:hypothetical protein [Streptomyces atratus]|uniref:hypothetical protein n=1 Tax=Streptomyces atratus TaxID=1893 RepID=UPI0034072047